MKILHLLSMPRAEGTPSLVLDWLGLPGHVQEVFCLHHAPADLTADLRAAAAWYSEGDLLDGRGGRKFVRMVLALWRMFRARRPDLVICWPGGFSCWVAAALRLALGWEPRLQVHCGNPPSRGPRVDWVSRAVLLPVWLLGGQCVCCSDYVRDEYRAVPGLPAKLFVTVYNCARAGGVHARAAAARLERERADTTAGARGVMVATFEVHKDQETLLRALPVVLARQPDFRLCLIGDGSRRARMEALAAELGLAGSVEFLGSRRDVPEWLGRSDLFVFSTTLQEGLGSVLIEALAAGLPIVASDVPACRETLRGGKYGRLVPPHSPDALAAGILAEFTSPTSAPPDREAYAARFTPEVMMRQYLALV